MTRPRLTISLRTLSIAPEHSLTPARTRGMVCSLDPRFRSGLGERKLSPPVQPHLWTCRCWVMVGAGNTHGMCIRQLDIALGLVAGKPEGGRMGNYFCDLLALSYALLLKNWQWGKLTTMHMLTLKHRAHGLCGVDIRTTVWGLRRLGMRWGLTSLEGVLRKLSTMTKRGILIERSAATALGTVTGRLDSKRVQKAA